MPRMFLCHNFHRQLLTYGANGNSSCSYGNHACPITTTPLAKPPSRPVRACADGAGGKLAQN